MMFMGPQTVNEWEARLGEQIRAVRIAADLSQRELAGLASLSETAVRSLERGAGSTTSTLVAVTRVLGREGWLDEFDERPAGPSPMELLRESRRLPAVPQRVRRQRT
jgi:transcriptional regulator with XRE-family HTH domain